MAACCDQGGTAVGTESAADTAVTETTAEDKLPFLPEGIDYGGVVCDLSWKDGRLQSFCMTVPKDGTYRIAVSEPTFYLSENGAWEVKSVYWDRVQDCSNNLLLLIGLLNDYIIPADHGNF